MQNQSAPAEGQSSESKKSVGRVVQPRLVRLLRWTVFNAGIGTLAWYAVNGSAGAGRLMHFVVWTFAVLMFLASLNKEASQQIAAKGRTIPAWMSHGWGAVLICFLVWHGWIGAAIAMLIWEIAEAAIFHEPNSNSTRETAE